MTQDRENNNNNDEFKESKINGAIEQPLDNDENESENAIPSDIDTAANIETEADITGESETDINIASTDESAPKEDIVSPEEDFSDETKDDTVKEIIENFEEEFDIQSSNIENNAPESVSDDQTDFGDESFEDDSNFIKYKEENKKEEKVTVRPVKFQQFQPAPPKRTIKKNLDIMQDIMLHVSVELGRTKSTIRDVINFETGSIIELNKIAGEQVEVFVNDKLVAKGEVIVIEDKFGIRVTNTSINKNPDEL